MVHLGDIACKIRRHILLMSLESSTPHVGSSFSCTDILVALFFGIADLNPNQPLTELRDRIILSKGHAAPTLYACLAERGYFPVSRLSNYAKAGSFLNEHPSRGALPGIECTTGSLGHGLGIGVGMAYAMRIKKINRRVFVVMSDGECNEGSTWEAALWAPARGLENLTVIIDYNKLQATGFSTKITSIEPLGQKWSDFGWRVAEIDGHNFDELMRELPKIEPETPRLIVAHTIKGKGVSFMENNLEWHYRPVNREIFDTASAELDGLRNERCICAGDIPNGGQG